MRHRAGRAPGALATAVLVTVTLVFAGCGDAGASLSPTGSAPATVAATATAPASATAAPISSAPTSAVPTTSPGLPSATPGVNVVMDPALLALLPGAIGTATVKIEPDAFAQATVDPSFVSNVDRAAFAIVVEGGDLASGVVAHLRPGAYSDALYRDWRDSYDAGACDQSGGVSAHAQAELGGRLAFITTCTGGLRIYHAYVPERDVIVSVFSLGTRRFGEQLVAGIRP